MWKEITFGLISRLGRLIGLFKSYIFHKLIILGYCNILLSEKYLFSLAILPFKTYYIKAFPLLFIPLRIILII